MQTRLPYRLDWFLDDGRRQGAAESIGCGGLVAIGNGQPPNLNCSSHWMASRWLAMICACQTSAMDMQLMEMTQRIRTRPMLDSLAGRWNTLLSQAMVRGLLVLGSACLTFVS